ncbi:MAG: DUF1579 domain-containing protein [Burkholderiales bacterium]|nr:DUF1579 domain-containing protein [Burkholderiales bacterium]
MNLLPSARRGLLVLAALAACPWAGQAAPNEVVQAQRAAMEPMAQFDGLWRGTAKVLTPDRRQVELVQTERVGPMLGGAIRVIEGRGHGADGDLQFNAFAVMSYDPAAKTYSLKSWAEGREGSFPVELRPDGFIWSIKAGPATIRYTATVKDGVWTEIGERLMEGQPPMRIFEMSVRKLGPSGWPQEGAVPPK